MAARLKSKGSILVVIMVTLIFAVTALVAFMDKASNDLLVASHVAVADRLRGDAYSALEVTLATLEDFREADTGLHSPGEGWGDPLAWAGWDPGDGNQVAVSFQDESGKIPLIHAGMTTLTNMFEYWQLPQDTSQHLADVIAGWMEKNHVSTTGVFPDYEQAAIPYDPPLRPLRSFSELAAIDFVKDTFFDPQGRPNDLWWRFYNDFSIFSFPQPNINGANSDVLGGVGQFPDPQQQSITDFLNGKGNFTTPSPLGKQWFSSADQVRGVVGGVGNPEVFGTTITALRILVTVTQGASHFNLSVVVAPKGGATIVTATATNTKEGTSNSATGQTTASNGLNSTASQSNSTATAAQTAAASTAAANLKYPFTILEIVENDMILTPPPPPPASS